MWVGFTNIRKVFKLIYIEGENMKLGKISIINTITVIRIVFLYVSNERLVVLT